tara:strand:- start:10306 stop:10488 length:183 start_codon:yes stop_codon:yes gene_type:complete
MGKFEAYFIKNIIPIIIIGNMFLFISWLIDGFHYSPLMLFYFLAVFYCGYKFVKSVNDEH